MRPSRHFPILTFAAVLVHAGAIAWVQYRAGRIDTYAFNSLDCGEYYAIARNLAYHGTFSHSESPPLTPDTWRTPGYPLFLASVIWVAGDSPTILILVQHLAAIGSVLLFFKIASRHMSTRRSGMASLLFLLEPYHLFYGFWLLSPTLFTFTLMGTWWAWERARESTIWWHYAALGLLSGFLVLIWPGAILVPVGVASALLLRQLPRYQITKSPNHWLAACLVVVGCLLPSIAWMTRNKIVARNFALSHQSGIVLAYFKATEVELWRQGRTVDRYVETSLSPANRDAPHTVWDSIDAKLCERIDGSMCGDLRWFNLAQGNKTSFDSFAVSRQLSAIGRSMLLDAPMDTITCGLVRVADNVTFPLSLAIRPAEGVPINRVKAAALGIAYALLAVAAVFGVVRARAHWPALYFPISCVIALALTTAPQIEPRFRVPLIPCLVFLALFPARRTES